MSIPTCPHCYRKVIFGDDGICPACGKDTNKRGEADQHKVLLRIRPGAPLPQICHNCGAPTKSTRHIIVSSERGAIDLSSGFMRFMAKVVNCFEFLDYKRKMNEAVDAVLKLPTCDQCTKRIRQISPDYVDYETRQLDLAVHVSFKKAMEQQSKSGL